jgi:hypothetical protein
LQAKGLSVKRSLMEMNVSHELRELETGWRTREQEWRRKLGRLRLGVEPLDEQLARYRRVTWALTAVPAIIAVMFLALFTAFGRSDIGAVVVAILFGPIIAFSWLGFRKLERRANAYLAELARFESERQRLIAAGEETDIG